MIVLGVLVLGEVAWAWCQGDVSYFAKSEGGPLDWIKDPKPYRSAMAYQALRAAVMIVLGLLIVRMMRALDRLDALSQDEEC